jgi:hypothetical protein
MAKKLPNPWRRDPEIDHIQLVPVDALDRVHQQTSGLQQARQPEEMPYIRFLMKKIAKNGFFHPVQLGKNERGQPRIIDGEHRTLVAMLLGLDRVPAYYHDPETDDYGKPSHKVPQMFTPRQLRQQVDVDRAMVKSGTFFRLALARRGTLLLKAYRPPRPGQRAPIPRQPWEMDCNEFCHPEDPRPLAGHRLLHAHVADLAVPEHLTGGIIGGTWASEADGDGPGTHLAISVPEYDDAVHYTGTGGAHIHRNVPPNHIVGVDPSMANSGHEEGPQRLSAYRKHPQADFYHAHFIQDALNAGQRVPDHVRAAHPEIRRRR